MDVPDAWYAVLHPPMTTTAHREQSPIHCEAFRDRFNWKVLLWLAP